MKEINLKDYMPKVKGCVIDLEAGSFLNEYRNLTGIEFPAWDRSVYRDRDEWFAELKVAVYRERANRMVYGEPEKVIPIPEKRHSNAIYIRNAAN